MLWYLMINRDLPEDSSVVRYVGFTRIRGGVVEGSAFSLRPGENGLSVNWLDYFHALTKEEQLDQVRQLIHVNVGVRAVFAELNVGDTLRFVSSELPAMRFVHSPAQASERYPTDPSHSEILGLPPSTARDLALLIGDLIAQCVLQLHPALSDN